MKIILTTTTSDKITIDDSKIMSSLYTINSSSDDELIIKSSSSASFNFSLTNTSKLYDNVNFSGSTFELFNNNDVQLGIFNVDNVTKANNIISIESLDNMILFDADFDASVLTYPTTIYTILSTICNIANVTLSTPKESIANADIIVNSLKNSTDKKTLRDILQSICEVTCSYAIINKDGELELRWYSLNNIVKSIDSSVLKTFTHSENQTVNGIYAKVNSKTYNKGTGSWLLNITDDNCILSNISESDINTVLTNEFAKLSDFTYVQANVKITTDFTLNVGDVIQCIDKDNNVYKIIISSISIQNNLSESIVSASKNQNNSYSSNSSGGSSSMSVGADTPLVNVSDENSDDVNCNNATMTINEKKLLNINTNSTCLLAFDCEFISDVSALVDFNIYVNDVLSNPIAVNCNVGENHICVTYRPNLITDTNSNDISVKLTSHSDITIKKFASKLSIIGFDMKANQSNITNYIKLNDLADEINLNGYCYNFNLYNLLDSLISNFYINNNNISENILKYITLNKNDTVITLNGTITENIN